MSPKKTKGRFLDHDIGCRSAVRPLGARRRRMIGRRISDRAVSLMLPSVPRRIVDRVAKRYIAGATLADAISVVADLNAAGCTTTVDILGEEARSWSDATRTLDEHVRVLDALRSHNLEGNISIKPTAFGLDLDRRGAYELMRAVVEEAESRANFVRIDMESSRTTDATLETYRKLQADGFAGCGIVLQAALRRSLSDATSLAGLRPSVRVCKGIYRESAAVAHQDPARIREAFVTLSSMLLTSGSRVAFATHDSILIDELGRMLQRLRVPRSQYEFQMLLGVRPELARELAAGGERVRIYVPFGERGYEYSLRRLRENPALAGHVARAAVRGLRGGRNAA